MVQRLLSDGIALPFVIYLAIRIKLVKKEKIVINFMLRRATDVSMHKYQYSGRECLGLASMIGHHTTNVMKIAC